VDVSQDVIIREIDCGTQQFQCDATDERVLIPVGSRLLGRVVAADVTQDPGSAGDQKYPNY